MTMIGLVLLVLGALFVWSVGGTSHLAAYVMGWSLHGVVQGLELHVKLRKE